MAITIRHPETSGRRMRNTIATAAVGVLVGVAGYGIVDIASDRGSGPASPGEQASVSLASEHGEAGLAFLHDTGQRTYAGFVGSNPPNLDPDGPVS